MSEVKRQPIQPSPCRTCWRESTCQGSGINCGRFRKWFRFAWATIRTELKNDK